MRSVFPSIVAGLLLLMSLSALFVLPVEPIAESSDDSLSGEQVRALEELPTSVKVSGRSGNSSTSPWDWVVKPGDGEWFDEKTRSWLGNLEAHVIAVDSSGNAYVTGSMGHGSSSYRPEIFIAKLNSSGSWEWAVKAGGDDWDAGRGIAVDSSGNVYVTGFFEGTATFGSTSLVGNGKSRDIFVAKLNSNGSWEWAVEAGSDGRDEGGGIAVDSSGNVYVTGFFEGTVTFGNISLVSNGSRDIVVAKLSSNGSWEWAAKAGGSDIGIGEGIVVDSSGNVYVAGACYNQFNFGSTELTCRGFFVAKLNSSGSWEWAANTCGDCSGGGGIAVDSSGNIYVTGYFIGTATFGSTNLTTSGEYDIFVAKLNSNGSWQWAVKTWGNHMTYANAIAVDSSGNAYVTGHFTGDINIGSTWLRAEYSWFGYSRDLFVAKLNSSGSWQWAVSTSGGDNTGGAGIAVDSSGNAYVTGHFNGTTSFGTISLSTHSPNHQDIFIAKMNICYEEQCPDTSRDFEVGSDGCSTLASVCLVMGLAVPIGVGLGIGVIIPIVIILIVKRRRMRNEDDDWDDDEDYEDDEFQEEEETNPFVSQSRTRGGEPNRVPPSIQQHNPWPESQLNGEWDDEGYEWLEHPENSDIWYWRDQQTGQWVEH